MVTRRAHDDTTSETGLGAGAADGIDVLVVEADPALRKHIVNLLTTDGYRVGEAEDGFDALHRIKSTRIGAIVLDPALPVLDGFDLLEKLSGTACPPIVMLRTDDAHKRGRMATGAHDHLMDPSALSLLMATALRAGGWLTAARRPSPSSRPVSFTEPPATPRAPN